MVAAAPMTVVAIASGPAANLAARTALNVSLLYQAAVLNTNQVKSIATEIIPDPIAPASLLEKAGARVLSLK